MDQTGCCSILDSYISTTGPIFLATRDLDVDSLDVLLQQDDYAEMVNEKDGGETADKQYLTEVT